ncbi:Trypanosome variant surface glycoprotein (A-type), putative [Trypanosoma equiperdum]|uniref:Trypanosome variant surface glycoprotein (A-type), putative n=1 Tax=Trypanosoma equiperdum TaxID=5694 RepID=A0A1G4I237_TRYEQ|nr:Trypanosome variant surface glycoprotein (A-type), putative [Trypanosoma equiperdum]
MEIRNQYAAVASIADLTFVANSSEATYYGVAETLWQPLCETVLELRKTAGIGAAQVATAVATYTSLQKLKMKLSAYGAKNTKDSDGIENTPAILIAMLDAKQRSILKSVPAIANNAMRATAYAAESSGAILSAMQTLQTQTTPTTIV